VGAFISYARADADIVTGLREDLERLLDRVWLDKRLEGGQDWWDVILDEVERCDVFVVALSDAWLASEACRAELDYAFTTGRRILPVIVQDIDLRSLPTQLQRRQAIRYESGDLVVVARAVISLLLQQVPALSVDQNRPPLPASYGEEYVVKLSAAALTPQEQGHLLADLERDLRNPVYRLDALRLLKRLRDRNDITHFSATRIDEVLEGSADTPTPQSEATPEPEPPDEYIAELLVADDELSAALDVEERIARKVMSFHARRAVSSGEAEIARNSKVVDWWERRELFADEKWRRADLATVVVTVESGRKRDKQIRIWDVTDRPSDSKRLVGDALVDVRLMDFSDYTFGLPIGNRVLLFHLEGAQPQPRFSVAVKPLTLLYLKDTELRVYYGPSLSTRAGR
jgi:hypothetical protein